MTEPKGRLNESNCNLSRMMPSARVWRLFRKNIVTSVAFERERRLSVFRLVVPQSLAIRVISRRSQVSICAHLAIAVIGMEWTLRRIDRDVIEVNTEAVSLGVSIREQAALEHLVRREANSGNHIRRGESGLLHFCEVAFRITMSSITPTSING